MTAERLASILLTTAIVFLPELAFAQVAGGGGFMSGAMNYVTSSVVPVVSTLAIVVLGIILMAMRFHPTSILGICAGVWVAANATTIYGYIRS